MQNKGFVKVFAVLLTLVCVFYLSFSFVTRHYTNKAKEIANGDPKVEQDYLDSLSNEKVWLGNWTLKQCREMEISLGLDLKGGMNVILEVSVPDVIKALADNKPDENFNKALNEAAKHYIGSHDFTSFCTLDQRKMGDMVRTVTEAKVERAGDMVLFTVSADGFLYNMVRIMVGTLLRVAQGKFQPEDIPHILEAKNRKMAGPTAPPCGLYLNRVFY